MIWLRMIFWENIFHKKDVNFMFDKKWILRVSWLQKGEYCQSINPPTTHVELDTICLTVKEYCHSSKKTFGANKIHHQKLIEGRGLPTNQPSHDPCGTWPCLIIKKYLHSPIKRKKYIWNSKNSSWKMLLYFLSYQTDSDYK